jgi:hypothetical protein
MIAESKYDIRRYIRIRQYVFRDVENLKWRIRQAKLMKALAPLTNQEKADSYENQTNQS